jgi:hypothetical protein
MCDSPQIKQNSLRIFKCPNCPKIFISQKYLDAHAIDHNRKNSESENAANEMWFEPIVNIDEQNEETSDPLA